MPTPFFAMAQLASCLADVNIEDDRGVEEFYVRGFPAFSEPIREEIFDWLSTLDTEPSPEDLDDFVRQLRARPDFDVRSTDVVAGSDAVSIDQAEHESGSLSAPL